MSAMAKIDLPYVQGFTDRHGRRMRYYFRRRGYGRVTLPDEPGSVAFAEAYEAALKASKPAATSVTEGPRSMGAAIAEYYLSADFRKMKPSSQKGHRGVLETFRSKFGTLSALTVNAKHLNTIFHQMADTPAQAANLRKRLNAVFTLIVDLGWREENPVQKSKRLKHKGAGFTPWTEDDIAAFEKHWPTGSRERLALALLLYTGVRRSDVVKIGLQHVKAGRIAVTQAKTGVAIKIPIHPRLQAEIDAAPKGMTFIVTQYGKPFSPPGFTSWFVERARLAGVLDKGPHGLRKAAGRRLAEAGCSNKEIAAVLGHSSVAMVEVYTKDADQERLADSAMAKVAENGS